MACSVVKTRESRPKTIEAGSLGGPGVNPFPFKGGGRDLCRIRRGKVLVERKTEIRDKRTPGRGTRQRGKWVPAAKRCDLVGVEPGLGGENRRLVV